MLKNFQKKNFLEFFQIKIGVIKIKFDKILLLQQNMLGDVIISTGFVKAVREEFPKSKIAFLVSPETAELVRLPFIDDLVIYDKGMPMLPVIKKIWRYDVALCLDFKYRSAVLPFLARIPIRAGLKHKRGIFMTHSIKFPPDKEGEYINEYMARILEECIGLKIHHDLTRLYVADATENDIAAVNKIMTPTENSLTIAFAPFSSSVIKDWSPAYYKIFMEKLNEKYNCRFVIIGGKNDAAKDFYLPENTLDLRGKISITESAEVLRRADYFVGGCSTPLHLAAAVGTPSLAFYGPSTPLKWAPRHKCITLSHLPKCSPCSRIGYGYYCNGNNFCMKNITVDEALTVFEKLREKFKT